MWKVHKSLSGLLMIVFMSLTSNGASKSYKVENLNLSFAEEVMSVINMKLTLVTTKIAQDPGIIQAVKDANIKNKDLSLSRIMVLDNEWKSVQGNNDFISSFLNNICSQRLIQFQNEFKGYPEIFITDVKGVMVAMTNKTSDYYQADEEGWIHSYDNGRGRSLYGDIEFNESAMTESIGLFIPVRDPEKNNVIGVIKVLVNIEAIKREL